MAVDLFGRGVSDSPVVRPIPSDSAVTFCKVGRNSPPAAICRRRLRRKGGWGSAIDCSLVVGSHGALCAPVTDAAERIT